MAIFQLDFTARTDGTHNIGHINLSPAQLVERFGKPKKCDEYKVSGQYTFVDDSARVYTLYDYKSTSLYNDFIDQGIESELPTPEEFWAAGKPYDFQIGGKKNCDVGAFKVWLRYEVG
jgi:hypothetical protein